MQFCQRNNDRDGKECISDPNHGKSIARICDELGSVRSLPLDTLIEIRSRLPEVHANYKERCKANQERTIPIQADTLCTTGFSQKPPAFPIKCRKDMAVYMKKKMNVNASATARNPGVVAGGAARTELGVLEVNTDIL